MRSRERSSPGAFTHRADRSFLRLHADLGGSWGVVWLQVFLTGTQQGVWSLPHPRGLILLVPSSWPRPFRVPVCVSEPGNHVGWLLRTHPWDMLRSALGGEESRARWAEPGPTDRCVRTLLSVF